MKRTRFGAWLAVAAMLSGLLCTSVYADTDARWPITVKNGAELAAAAQNAGDGDTIILSSDITCYSGINFDIWAKNITLDVNGCNLSIEDESTSAIKMEGWDGSLTLIDSAGGGSISAVCLYDGEPTIADTSGIRVEGKAQSLIIDGVKVLAEGGKFGAGIGASVNDVGKILIRSGEVTADGGSFGAGIGGGLEQFAGDIEIYGGVITANGGSFGSAIGTGGFTVPRSADKNNSVYITGGSVTANGGSNGAGIGGGQLASANVQIEGGKISAYGGSFGAGIGTGKMNVLSGNDDFVYDEAKIYITGGNVLAKGGSHGAGIGTGEGAPDYSFEEAWTSRALKIDGGNVLAYGGENGAGIGGGAYFSGGNVEIAQTEAQTYVEAYGGESAAGIGGGLAGLPGAMIKIYDGTVIAAGGENGAGIGSGEFGLTRLEPSDIWAQSVKNIAIAGGHVEATAGENAAAIGGGNCGSGAYVAVYGSPTVIAASNFENTIGAGMYATSQGNIRIDGGNVRVNNQISADMKNSYDENIYEKTLRVVAADGVTPVENTEITTRLGHYSYPATTNSYGYAYVYLPHSEEAAVETFARGNTFVADVSGSDVSGADVSGADVSGSDVSGRSDNITEIVLSDYEPVEILSKSHVYFLDNTDNTYQLSWKGKNVTFEIDSGSTGITIEPKTGMLTFPVQLRPGEYNLNIKGYSDGSLADSAAFVLTVAERDFSVGMGSDINADEKEIILSLHTPSVISVSTDKKDDEIKDVYWKVTSGNETGCIIEKQGENQGTSAKFTGLKAGDYSVTATVIDIYDNRASNTVAVKVEDPFDFDYRAVAVANLGLPTIEDIENKEEPRIIGWSVYRNSPEKVDVVFKASKKGEYFYSVVPRGEMPEYFEGSFTALEGLNSFDISGLNPKTEYDIHLKLVDVHKQESPSKVLNVTAFESPDITPPLLSDFHIDRGRDYGELTFNSNKDGFYRYALYENGTATVSTADNYTIPQSLVPGENKILFSALDDENDYEVFLFGEDIELNRTPDYRFSIEPFTTDEDKDEPFTTVAAAKKDEPYVKSVLVPKFEALEVVKPSESSAMVTVMSNTDCEYFVGVTQEEQAMSPIDIYGKGMTISEGENGVLIPDLLPNVAYRVGIVGKNASGELGEPVFVKIPAEEAFTLEGTKTNRITDSIASLYFESASDGTVHFTAVEKDTPLAKEYDYSEVLCKGPNRIVIDDLEKEKEYDAYVLAVDAEGNYSNPIKMSIGLKAL